MALDFNKYAQKGNEFVNRIAVKLGHEKDTDRAARILRSVLRVLRNHLTVEESMQLLAQLPIALKGVYVDGWKMNKQQERLKTMNDFVAEVIKEEGTASWRDFSTTDEPVAGIRAVWETLAEYISGGEMEDIIGVLPRHLQNEFRGWLQEI